MSSIRTRPATPADREFITRTAARLSAFGPPPWRTPSEIVEPEVQALEAFFVTPLSGSAMFVVEDGGERLGFVLLERRVDYFTGRPHGHVSIIAISAAAEGRGAGAALMAAAEAWAREQGYGTLTLNVFAGNQRARAMYERCGFQVETLKYVKPLG
jgi:ribosomal protein S18 acetylase RimI-like enzyme